MPAFTNLQSAGMAHFSDGGDAPTGKVFTATAFIDSERRATLDRRSQYSDATQHDKKRFDFDGRILMSGTSGLGFTQPMLTSERAAFYVPLRARRPSAPYRLATAVRNAFTNFIFGEGRFPSADVPGDDDSQDFIQTCVKVGHLPLKMVQARNVGGKCGTVGLSWSFLDGKPRFGVHHGRNLFVQEWQDREELVPRHVTECFQVFNEEWDGEKKAVVKKPYWHRRDWTMNAEVVFKLVPVEPEKDPDWEAAVDVEKSVIHEDNDTHFVWCQNLPNEEDVDGFPDYEAQYESLDELDTMLSVIVRGAKLNLDPTLVIKEDAIRVARMGIKKGSDNALIVDKDGGDAKYLELSGSSIEAGLKLFNEHRRTILEATECVIPDPDQIAAQGQSAAAQKMIFSRMLSKGGTLQEQYGTALERLLEPVLYIAQARVQVPVQVTDEEGNIDEKDQSFDLPKRIKQKPVIGDDGQPTGASEPEASERHPGAGENVDLQWPPRFPPTSLDQQQLVTTLSTAVGAQPIMSQQTATELTMEAFGRDGKDEWEKVQADKKQADAEAKQANADPGGAGGKVPAPNAPPPGAKPPGGSPKPPGGGAGKPPKGGGNLGDAGDKDAEPPAD